MPFLAIIVDFIAVGLYHIQAINLTSSILLIGLIGQTLITLVLLIFTFQYKGPRFTRYQLIFYRFFSIRYAIIFLSMLVNALVLFLYYLNYSGINPLIFQ
ncbi:hypothetical protein FC26_GL002354 [Paucilactobacillus vaccinostercus DSM 20634]|uniref:Uncharacterized protein n=1 Tax=Paucilactobacillus vaccinostercus DSM 20634 TaxID=1423813 RepID=A0A0R2A2F9_9LACO|nr:hypothetical protein [Paucilactobacillus vaccinostercus]KRM61136.1 hypothetical protein FC26_GL002354 [Paucilactobacillus vaccinostercus DSM 20634]